MDEMDIDPGFDKISDEDLDTLVWQYHNKTLVEGVLTLLVVCVLHIPYVFNATAW